MLELKLMKMKNLFMMVVTELMLLKDTVSDQTLISHSELIIFNNPNKL